MKIKLSLLPVNRGPFNSMPAREVELDADKILCNDVRLPWESMANRLYVIGNEFGAICAVWADHEGDALDEAMDADLLDSFLVSEEDQKESLENDADEAEERWTRLGNYGKPCNLDHAWIQLVRLDSNDFKLLCAFAEARGLGAETLDDGRITLSKPV